MSTKWFLAAIFVAKLTNVVVDSRVSDLTINCDSSARMTVDKQPTTDPLTDIKVLSKANRIDFF